MTGTDRLGQLHLEFARRLGEDWRPLAIVLAISAYDQRRFIRGDEAHSIWERLADREELERLPPALAEIGRPDLATLLLAIPDLLRQAHETTLPSAATRLFWRSRAIAGAVGAILLAGGYVVFVVRHSPVNTLLAVHATSSASSRRAPQPTALSPQPNRNRLPGAGTNARSVDARASPPASPITRTLVVQNQVTNGATTMREDSTAIYLSTQTVPSCKAIHCDVPGTDMWSGQRIIAACQTHGGRMTNGEDDSSVDDRNPGLYTSRLWYRIIWSTGRWGYISDVWISAAGRGGAGLPSC